MVSDKFKSEPNHTWIGFLRLMESKYSSEIIHAPIRFSVNSVSISEELKSETHGDPSTRNRRAVIRTVNTILKYAKDLPTYERTNTCLLQYLRNGCTEHGVC